MEILYFLIPVSVLLVFFIGFLFWWSLRSGQYDDLEGPGYRVLMDDDKAQGVTPKKMQEKGAEKGQEKGQENPVGAGERPGQGASRSKD